MSDRGRGPDTPGGLQPLGASLERLLGSMNAPPVDVISVIFGSWTEIVGETLAAHTRPAAIDGEHLVVAADDPAWASEFRWLESEVLVRLAAVSGSSKITSLSVRVEPPRK